MVIDGRDRFASPRGSVDEWIGTNPYLAYLYAVAAANAFRLRAASGHSAAVARLDRLQESGESNPMRLRAAIESIVGVRPDLGFEFATVAANDT